MSMSRPADLLARPAMVARCRASLTADSLLGSMGWRGNPYDKVKVESFMKTVKVEEVHPMAYAMFERVVENLPHLIDRV
jgi:putative transposase